MSDIESLPTSTENKNLVALGESLMKKEVSSSNLTDAESLISVDGVKMFNITSDGEVSSAADSLPLHVVKCKSQPILPPVFLHIGDWVYPLIPSASPVLHSNTGAFIFPDLMALLPGNFVGLIFPETVSVEVRKKFEDIIKSLTVLIDQVSDYLQSAGSNAGQKGNNNMPDTADKISKDINKAAEWISHKVEKGAQSMQKTIENESQKIQQKPKQSQALKIDPKLLKGVIYAREVTDSSVKVSDAVVNVIGEMTLAVAKTVAPQITQRIKALGPENFQAASGVDTSSQAAGSGSQGFQTIYASLDAAATALERSLTNTDL